jgi:signal transduction histidine kinase
LQDAATNLKITRESIRSYAAVMTKKIEDEKRSISRDLHDDTLQSLIALKQQLQIGSRGKVDPALINLVQNEIDKLRILVRDLRPAFIDDLGLQTAVDMLLRDLSSKGNVKFTLTVSGNESRLSQDKELAIYRIIQEACNNILRHSQATDAHITMAYTGKAVEVTIEDNGCGFTIPDQIENLGVSGHFGLLGMKERADSSRIDWSVTSKPGSGTTVKIQSLLVEEENLLPTGNKGK